ncbi:MAG: hypothetical protein GPOALKHO_000746 [Sodalis sp.]|nr:MAG: hypothetical protein GPOALKHO_000746 [Sodalis sp.]
MTARLGAAWSAEKSGETGYRRALMRRCSQGNCRSALFTAIINSLYRADD